MLNKKKLRYQKKMLSKNVKLNNALFCDMYYKEE